jgi:hypothetical protein
MKGLGIYFDNIHSYYDLDLFLSKDGVEISPAEPKTVYVDVAGGDGSLDLTEAFGEVKFNDRECTFTFTVNPASDMTFEEKKTQVSNALNGKKCKITLDKDADYYYTGRCAVNEYSQDRRLLQIVVSATVKPYKLKQNKTIATYTLTEKEQTVVLKNGRKSVVPEITCTNDNTVVVFGNVTETLSAGTHKILDIYLKEGSNILKLSGSGTITFKYQEGEL